MNPADAFRKEQRKKENVRNKKERDWLRAANQKIDKPDELRTQLKDLIEKEQAGFNLNRDEKLKKRILQDAYDLAVKRKTVGAAHPRPPARRRRAGRLPGAPPQRILADARAPRRARAPRCAAQAPGADHTVR